MDVNSGASPAPSGSSPDQGQTGTQQGSGQGVQSDGTLNTDQRTPESIPYARFKEVNDKFRALESEYAPYKEKQDLYKTYEHFDQVLSSNPVMFELAKIALTNPERAQAIAQHLGIATQQQGQPQQQQGASQDPAVSQLVLMTYTNEFQRLASEAKIPQELLPEYFEMTKGELLRLNSDPLRQINLRDLQNAFVKATERARKFTTPYQQQKAQDAGLPASASANGGQPVAGQVRLQTQQDRGAWLADQMKAGRIL